MRYSSFLLVSVLLVALGACSSLLADVEGLTDVYGLDGAVIVLQGPDAGDADRSSEMARTLEAGATTLIGTVAGSLPVEGFDLPPVVSDLARAASVRDVLTIDPVVIVHLPDGETGAPAAFSIDGVDIDLVSSHEGAAVSGVGGAASFVPAVVVTKASCSEGTDGPRTCTYDAAVHDEARVAIDASRAAALFDALVAGGTFGVDGSVQVTLAAPGVPKGTTVLVTLRAVPQAGVIRFR